jgi:hypothetical protein
MERAVHFLPLPVGAAYAISLAFATAGLMQLIGIGVVRRAYLRWDYPVWFYRAMGALELIAALFLATEATRPLGIALVATINFIAVVLLLKNRAYILALPGFAVTAALPLTLIPTH